jgi:release factor glutamine methyltransferase
MRTGYDHVEGQLKRGTMLFLDGPSHADPHSAAAASRRNRDADLFLGPEDLVRIHRSYVEAGCDIVRTLTSRVPRVPPETGSLGGSNRERPLRWVDVAKERIEAARAASAGTAASVAFTVGHQVDGPDAGEIMRVLSRLFRQAPPDLILVETLSILRPSLYRTVSGLRSLGIPVWLSFRRCCEGMCGPGGHHWAGDGPDSFGHAAYRFEQLGIGALLINCIPRDHVEGTIDYLRYFTDLPLGAYPDLDAGLSSEMPGTDGSRADYLELAQRWRREGAQIIGGCCGTDPELLAKLRHELVGDVPSAAKREPAGPARETWSAARQAEARSSAQPWVNARGRRLYPLPLPAVARHDGVGPPAAGDLLLWEYLYREGSGANQRCLHVGSGNGLLAVQLALNGATHVHAVDIAQSAVRCTLESAFLNEVGSSLTAEVADLNSWLPREHYELVVASLEQPPMDPCQQDPCIREFDPWGRRLIDGLIAKLPIFLAREGVAYLTQTSIISQRRTMEMLSAAGMEAEVVDWHFWPVSIREEDRSHIDQIENVSDAFHFRIAGHEEVLVVYLLEIRRRHRGAHGGPAPAPSGRPAKWA